MVGCYITNWFQIRADYKLIAKALGRIGSAYQKKGDNRSAIRFFEKSLSEHRTPEILAKLRETEKTQEDADRVAYINPQLSAAERENGNALFKAGFSDKFLLLHWQLFQAGDFAEAVKAYSEAIRRDPSDARGYNNRAAALSKLVALPDALKDAEEAIRLDPKFGSLLVNFPAFWSWLFARSESSHSALSDSLFYERI